MPSRKKLNQKTSLKDFPEPLDSYGEDSFIYGKDLQEWKERFEGELRKELAELEQKIRNAETLGISDLELVGEYHDLVKRILGGSE